MSNFSSYILQVPDKSHSHLSQDDISGLCGPSIPSSLYLHPHSHIQTQSYRHQPCISLVFLSQGANLHYRDELSYCVDSTVCLLQERAGLSPGHWHHAMTWLQGSVNLLFKKHLTQRITGWLPPLLCWGPTHSLTEHCVQSVLFHFHSLYGQNISFKIIMLQ